MNNSSPLGSLFQSVFGPLAIVTALGGLPAPAMGEEAHSPPQDVPTAPDRTPASPPASAPSRFSIPPATTLPTGQVARGPRFVRQLPPDDRHSTEFPVGSTLLFVFGAAVFVLGLGRLITTPRRQKEPLPIGVGALERRLQELYAQWGNAGFFGQMFLLLTGKINRVKRALAKAKAR